VWEWKSTCQPILNWVLWNRDKNRTLLLNIVRSEIKKTTWIWRILRDNITSHLQCSTAFFYEDNLSAATHYVSILRVWKIESFLEERITDIQTPINTSWVNVIAMFHFIHSESCGYIQFLMLTHDHQRNLFHGYMPDVNWPYMRYLSFLRVKDWDLTSASQYCSVYIRDGPWPDLTQAYFWPAVNKRPARLWPGSFLTWPEEKKIEKFDIFLGNFPNSKPNHKWLTRPEPQKIDPTRPGSKILTWTHH